MGYQECLVRVSQKDIPFALSTFKTALAEKQDYGFDLVKIVTVKARAMAKFAGVKVGDKLLWIAGERSSMKLDTFFKPNGIKNALYMPAEQFEDFFHTLNFKNSHSENDCMSIEVPFK